MEAKGLKEGVAVMAGEQNHKKSQKARSGFFTKVVLLLLLVGIGWQLFQLSGQVREAEAERDAVSGQVEAQRQENAALEEDLQTGATQEQMEEIARDELGMVAPGEKVFYDVSN